MIRRKKERHLSSEEVELLDSILKDSILNQLEKENKKLFEIATRHNPQMTPEDVLFIASVRERLFPTDKESAGGRFYSQK